MNHLPRVTLDMAAGRDCFPKTAPACISKVDCLYKVSSY